jgi:serine/threonine protein kinase
MMIIMPYYSSGDLLSYITAEDFYNIEWWKKLDILKYLICGLKNIHNAKIVHRDFHSGNMFFDNNLYINSVKIGDFGLSKSATAESKDDDNNEIYGIIPYMAPEIFLGQKYTTASDIYSFGMIMWELMTGRRPFCDRSHDTDLIIGIVDGSRPPIVTNAPEGYIELMEECWHFDPNKRPTATNILEKINDLYSYHRSNPIGVTKSPDIEPITKNNPGAIYKSRPLSGMIHSAMSLRSSRNKSIGKQLYYLYTFFFHICACLL